MRPAAPHPRVRVRALHPGQGHPAGARGGAEKEAVIRWHTVSGSSSLSWRPWGALCPKGSWRTLGRCCAQLQAWPVVLLPSPWAWSAMATHWGGPSRQRGLLESAGPAWDAQQALGLSASVLSKCRATTQQGPPKAFLKGHQLAKKEQPGRRPQPSKSTGSAPHPQTQQPSPQGGWGPRTVTAPRTPVL